MTKIAQVCQEICLPQHKLLYKLLTTLCVVLTVPPQSKSLSYATDCVLKIAIEKHVNLTTSQDLVQTVGRTDTIKVILKCTKVRDHSIECCIEIL